MQCHFRISSLLAPGNEDKREKKKGVRRVRFFRTREKAEEEAATGSALIHLCHHFREKRKEKKTRERGLVLAISPFKSGRGKKREKSKKKEMAEGAIWPEEKGKSRLQGKKNFRKGEGDCASSLFSVPFLPTKV